MTHRAGIQNSLCLPANTGIHRFYGAKRKPKQASD